MGEQRGQQIGPSNDLLQPMLIPPCSSLPPASVRPLSPSTDRITLSTVGLLPQLQHFLDRYGPEPLAHHQQHHQQQHHRQEHPHGSAAASSAANPGPQQNPDAPSGVRDTGASCATSTNDSSSGSWSKGGPGGVEAPGRGPGGRPLVSLAVSLHAGSDALRDVIVPSNTRLRAPPAAAAAPATAHAQQQEAQQIPHSETSGRKEEQQQGVLGAGPHAAEDGRTVAAVAGGAGGAAGGGVSRLMSVLSAHYPRTDRRPLRAGRYVLFEYTMLAGESPGKKGGPVGSRGKQGDKGEQVEDCGGSGQQGLRCTGATRGSGEQLTDVWLVMALCVKAPCT